MVLIALMLGCSDYNLTGENDNSGGRDTSVVTDPCGFEGTPVQALEMVEECVPEPEIGGWTPVIEWSSTAPGDTYTTPAVANLTDDNGDGVVDHEDIPDVVVSNAVGVTWALSGADGTPLWNVPGAGSEPASPAIGDVDGDGLPEVVVGGGVSVRALDGATGAVEWTSTQMPTGRSLVCGAIGLYDLDGNGEIEVVLGNTVLNGWDGSMRSRGGYGTGSGHPYAASMGVAADIDGDGSLEVVTGNALYRLDGSIVWYNGQSDGFVAVANFDGDDKGEIVVADQGTLRLQDDDGSVLWSKPGLTGSTIGPPTVADFDNDGEPEIGVAGNGVYKMVEGDGTVRWTRSTQDYSSGFTGSSVFDFEGDGAAEVVYADENSVWVFSGANGEPKMEETRHSSATCSEYPVIADVDNDGHAEIIYSSGAYSGTETGVTVIGDSEDSWQAARPVWNQHTYSVTHIDDDGKVVSNPDTNWLSYNTFRSGDEVAGQGGELADLVVEVQNLCEECADDRVTLSYRVGNQGRWDFEGAIALELLVVTPDGQQSLHTEEVELRLDMGTWGATQTLEFAPGGLDIRALVLRVQPVGGLAECSDDNNEGLHTERVCG